MVFKNTFFENESLSKIYAKEYNKDANEVWPKFSLKTHLLEKGKL